MEIHEQVIDGLGDHGVYVLLGQINGAIGCKIGMSSTIQMRIYQVCQTCPFELQHAFILCAGSRIHARSAERALHRMLKGYRTRGEWFMFDPQNPKHKEDLHRAVGTVAAMKGMPKLSLSVADVRKAVNAVQAIQRAENAEDRREARKYGRQRAVIAKERRQAQKADRYARAREFEERCARDAAATLAARTFRR